MPTLPRLATEPALFIADLKGKKVSGELLNTQLALEKGALFMLKQIDKWNFISIHSEHTKISF